MIMKNLSEVLSSLMSEKGLSSSELARQTGVAQPIIYRLTKGDTTNPQIFTLKPIADFFDISLDQLIGAKPLRARRPLNDKAIHLLNGKLTTIATVAGALNDVLPHLEKSYRLAIASKLMTADIPEEILPLLQLNVLNLIKAIESIRAVLKSNQLCHSEEELV